jgi:hypothetical protein
MLAKSRRHHLSILGLLIALGGCGVDTEAGLDSESAPVAAFTLLRTLPLTVALDASTSSDDHGITAYAWDFGDGQTGTGKTVEHTYATSGCYQVTLVVSDAEDAQGQVQRTFRVITALGSDGSEVALEGMPLDGAVLPRDLETNEATITLTGVVPTAEFEAVVVRLSRGFEIESELRAELCGERFILELPLAAERVARRIDVGLVGLGVGITLASAENVMAGDVFIVNGQSNAVAGEFSGSADENLSPFVRSFGSRTENVDVHRADGVWRRAEATGFRGAVGQWPLRMAAQLSERFSIPIALINGARSGRPIGYFRRNDDDPEDATTNYGRLLDRTLRGGLLGKVRAILYYQGESDGANAQAHHDGFVALHEHWRADYPGVERFYVTQVRRGCGGQVATREVQRRFASELPNTSVMSTTGLNGHDGCHFAYAEGYRELGDRYANLIARDLYGADPEPDTEAVDVGEPRLEGDRIIVPTTGDASGLVVEDGVEAFFTLSGGTRRVRAVRAEDSDLILELTDGSDPTGVAFIGHARAGPWVTNRRGIGLLAFLLDL